MTRASKAIAVAVLITVAVLVWVAAPTVRATVPAWVIIDGLVAQVVILTALSGLFASNTQREARLQSDTATN